MPLTVDVVPLLRLPREVSQFFTYLVPKNINPKIGQLVSVPFRNRLIKGVIYRINVNEKQIFNNLKEVKEVTSVEPYLTTEQMSLVEFFSVYYLAPLSLTLKNFFPPQINYYSTYQQNPQINFSFKVKRKQPPSFFLLGKSAPLNLDYLLSYLNETFLAGKQILILTPTLHQLRYFEEELKKITKYPVLALHSKLNKRDYNAVIGQIRTKKNLLVIGLRQGLFAPFSALGLIIVVDAEHPSYKQWNQQPKYDALVIAKKLAELHQASIIYISPWPSIVHWHDLNRNLLSVVAPSEKILAKIKVVHLDNNANEKKFSLIADKIIEKITEEKNNRWLFWLNRAGVSSFITCQDCGWQAVCENCHLLLVESGNQGLLSCNRCNRNEIFPSFCPKCNGVRIKKIGGGTQKVIKILNSILPQNSSIILCTKESSSLPLKALDEKLLVVSTDAILSYPNLPVFDKIVIVNADLEISSPGWQGKEKFLQKIWQALTRLTPHGILYIQSRQPEFYRSLTTMKAWKTFIEEELEKREKYNYPPFQELILLTKFFKSAPIKINPIDDLIKKLSTLRLPHYTAYPQPVKTKRGWEYYFLIRLNPQDQKIKKSLFAALPGDWQVDINPMILPKI